jgi:hypothetical protein
MKNFLLILVLLAASAANTFASTLPQQDSGEVVIDRNGFLPLDRDQVVPGGFPDPNVLTDPKLAGGDKVILQFPLELRVKNMAFRSKSGKIYKRDGKLPKNTKLICVITKRTPTGRGTDALLLEARMAAACGNWFDVFQLTAEVPSGAKGEVRFQHVAIVRPEAYVVDKTAYVTQTVPQPNDVNINLPSTERPGFTLEVTGEMRAERYWRYRKDLWDYVLGFLNAASYPLGQIFSKGTNISVSATASQSQSQAMSQSQAQSQSQSQAQGQQNGGG